MPFNFANYPILAILAMLTAPTPSFLPLLLQTKGFVQINAIMTLA
jgi:hypothetical protein